MKKGNREEEELKRLSETPPLSSIFSNIFHFAAYLTTTKFMYLTELYFAYFHRVQLHLCIELWLGGRQAVFVVLFLQQHSFR